MAEVAADTDIAPLTTMRVGGPARQLITAQTAEEVVDAVRAADAAGTSLLVLGGGSNVVVADEGFPGTVVQVADRGIRVESDDACGGVHLKVAAGEVWDDVVARAVTEGWSGIEALSGIPGSVGATPVQNVGAYGQEVAQTVAQVRTWDRVDGRIRTLFAADCGFSYRHSVLKESMQVTGQFTPRYVVLEVTFALRPTELSGPIGYADLARGLDVAVGERVPLGEARAAVLEQRRRRGMVLDEADHDTWSCGSFFTNPILPAAEFEALTRRAAERLGPDGPVPPQFPSAAGTVKTSAAWLIDKAGFAKGHGMPGPAALSTKHTLALTNRGAARSRDIVALAREVRAGVQEAFGVTLVNEPVLIGLSL